MYTLLCCTDLGPPYTIEIRTESTGCWYDLVRLWYLLLYAVDRVLSFVWFTYVLCQLTLSMYVFTVALSAVRTCARPSSGAKWQKTVLQLLILFRTRSLLLLVWRNAHVDQPIDPRFCTNVCLCLDKTMAECNGWLQSTANLTNKGLPTPRTTNQLTNQITS